MSADWLFCRIALGEAAVRRVYENKRILAFLDIGPIWPRHTQTLSRDGTRTT